MWWALWLAGCMPKCGEYEISVDAAYSEDGVLYDGDGSDAPEGYRVTPIDGAYFEECGTT